METQLPFGLCPWLEGLSGCEGSRIQEPAVGGLLGAGCLLGLMMLFEVISQVCPHSPDRRTEIRSGTTKAMSLVCGDSHQVS